MKVTKIVLQKIWKLHQEKVSRDTIALTLEISPRSVDRYINMMCKASKGENIDDFEGGRCKPQIELVKSMFNLCDSHQKESDSLVDNTATYLINLIQLIEKQNLLLEKISTTVSYLSKLQKNSYYGESTQKERDS